MRRTGLVIIVLPPLLRVLGSTGTIRFPFGQTISQIENLTFEAASSYLLAAGAAVACLVILVIDRRRHHNAGLPTKSVAAIAMRTGVVVAVGFLAVWELNRSAGVPVALVILIGLVLIFWTLTTQTRYGQHVFAVGGNAEAAHRAGIGVTAVRVSVFTLSGATAALGGIMSGSYTGAASQELGGDILLLRAIAAAVIGGASLFGGRGSAWAALLGWLVIGAVVVDALTRRGRTA